MKFIGDIPAPSPARQAIRDLHLADETEAVRGLLGRAGFDAAARGRIAERAVGYVGVARQQPVDRWGLDAFLHEYSLSSEEGIVLMCLAEALLRIPDHETADRLIRDKMTAADWAGHLGKSESLLVNASTWALMLTGRVIRLDRQGDDLRTALGRVVSRTGEPVIREAMTQAMRILGRQFVMGRTIGEALARAAEDQSAGSRHSFDMLGEAAHTAADAARYLDAYRSAIDAIARDGPGGAPEDRSGVSVKLSALHPRYEYAQRGRAMSELVPCLADLVRRARDAGIALTVDAEEARRLELSLDVFEAVYRDPGLAGYDGLGLAVQAYQKRAPAVLDWLRDLAGETGRRIPVRLVKGAYWDSEIKRAQELGLSGYPVFTRKSSTDVSYLACVRMLLDAPDAFLPQFATHNAHTAAAVAELAAGSGAEFEFQRLHGMGEELHVQVATEYPVRVYAPVGSHEDLLPYLVRRLLENGANTSFVNRLVDENAPVEEVVADPVARTEALSALPHPQIPLPRDLYPAGRVNAAGRDLTDPAALVEMAMAMEGGDRSDWIAAPVVDGAMRNGDSAAPVRNPANRNDVVGRVTEATADDVAFAVSAARDAFRDWDALGGEVRAGVLEGAADLIEADMAVLATLCVREAGKSLADAVAEVREAVDFCRYYAGEARRLFGAPTVLPGPTGERDTLALQGRGVFACISPWNFPLAIFTGQVAAALAAGNAVVAKPAEQTPLIAARAVALLHEAGVPAAALDFLPGDGETVGAALISHPGIDGVAFTGSVEVARSIARTLAAADGPIRPLIAETGGLNAMIVDSSALTEQVVTDVIASAFLSAGQRCSALRMLCLQDDVADRTLEMLTGAMAELRVGDPARLDTDIGPVIDDEARDKLAAHCARMTGAAKLLYRCEVAAHEASGTWFPPHLFELPDPRLLEAEVFGPVLHVIRYGDRDLDRLLDDIRATRYGLTLGIHSRIDSTIDRIAGQMPVGNIYVNRSMVGSVVGVQPFGGEGLSGTGPKAGGPHYLQRFAVERALSVNTVAMGGNTELLSLDPD